VTDGPDAFDPATYDEVVAEIPDYERLQAEVAAATTGLRAGRFLDLGAGTGATALAVLDRHPGAAVVLLDESEAMLAAARTALGAAEATSVVAGLEDPLPAGPFDLVVSALAVHHLAGRAKAELFARVAGVLAPGGRFVLGDIVVPDDPADVVTPVDGVVDVPSPAADQLTWIEEAGLTASVAWAHRDLAVLVGDKPSPLYARLREALSPALKARDRVAVAALRSALAAVDNAQAVDAPPAPRSGGVVAGAVTGLGAGEAPRRELSEGEIVAIVRAEVDDRREAAADYERAGKTDAAGRLTAEADVLAALLAPG